jgi:CRP/FNR family transcriptional regulator
MVKYATPVRRDLPGGGPSFMASGLWTPEASPGRPLIAEDRAMLATIATIVRFKKGETIYQDGENAAALFNMITGFVTCHRLLPGRKRHIVGFAVANDLIGLPQNGIYVNTAEAATAVTLYKISASAFEARLRQHADLEFQVIGKLCQVLRDAQDHALLLSKRRAAARLGMFLLMLEARQACQGTPDGEVFLPMRRSDIGSYVGISAEAVTRTLRDLSQHGVIAFHGRRHVRIVARASLEMIVQETWRPPG